ncbi:hypothetical protein [Pseudonocardia humida]|uniref:6-phosphogluconate dehydrogenase-like protein n=1 Tax=Pseudonocardia humida TaxID=2800819 RepID=A0ABT1A1C3_9PSEU|nr:hypothetical protein [Pseudonocardia humida]MCO1656720.1 hypothetical protein [Pseudonocardia humida]
MPEDTISVLGPGAMGSAMTARLRGADSPQCGTAPPRRATSATTWVPLALSPPVITMPL